MIQEFIFENKLVLLAVTLILLCLDFSERFSFEYFKGTLERFKGKIVKKELKMVSNTETEPKETEVIIPESTEPTCSSNDDCNVVFGDGENVCSIEGVCICNKGGSGRFCHRGPTNYKDPKDMTEDQRNRFKQKYRTDFTVQDYKNWLNLYKLSNESEFLYPAHQSNYTKFVKGDKITAKDLPQEETERRITAAEKFMVVNKNRFSLVPFPFTNEDDVSNKDNGTVFQDPRDIGKKVIDLDELNPKKSAKKLRQYLGPSPSESAHSDNFKFN